MGSIDNGCICITDDSNRITVSSARALFHRFGILLIRYRAEPCVLVGLRIAFDSQMGEPAVRSCPVPMHHVRCYFDHIRLYVPTAHPA